MLYAEAIKVVKKVEKLPGDKLHKILSCLNCSESELGAQGYFATTKKGEYVTYETESDLRDSEQIVLEWSVYEYFMCGVKPRVEEAWIKLEGMKIGYKISFNKYFYKHIPLRSIAEVKAELLTLEEQADGMLNDILNF